MISKKICAFLFLPVLIALIYGGCGGSSSSDSQQPQATPNPTPQPTQQPGACNSPSLNTPYIDDATEEFYSFTQTGSTLDTKVFSDGSTVFVIVNDGSAIFGFRGVPGGAGTSCEFIKASVDYDNDGAFDETAKSFSSRCLRLDNGASFTFLDGPSSVDASPDFEERLLLLYNQVIYFNVQDAFSCDLTEPVPESGIYEPLLHQLQAEISSL